MAKQKFSIADRLRITLRAFDDSGAFFRGVGQHLDRLKTNVLGVFPRTVILPQAVLLFDVFLAFLSLFIAIYLRVGDEFLDYTPGYILKNMIVFVLTSLSVFIWMQTHRALWRYFSLEDCVPLTLSVVLSSILYFPLMILLAQQESLPRSVPFLNALVYIVLLCLPRFIYRSIYDRHTIQKKRLLSEQAVPVLLVGNSDATELFIREVMHSPALSYQPVGILSPNAKEKGRRIHTVPILSLLETGDDFLKEIRSLAKRPVQIIITDTDLSHEFLTLVSNISQRCSLPMMQMLPQFTVVEQNNSIIGMNSNNFLAKKAS
jgi:FlaA1/EpsC-like NDP-sugar epimerase